MKQVSEICQQVAHYLDIKEPRDLFSEKDKEWLKIIDYQLKYLSSKNSIIQEGEVQIKTPGINLLDQLADFNGFVENTSIYIKDTENRVIKSYLVTKKHDPFDPIFGIRYLYPIIEFHDWKLYWNKICFMYYSKNIVWDWNTFTSKNEITSNNDVSIFDEHLVEILVLKRYLDLHIEDILNNKLRSYTDE